MPIPVETVRPDLKLLFDKGPKQLKANFERFSLKPPLLELPAGCRLTASAIHTVLNTEGEDRDCAKFVLHQLGSSDFVPAASSLLAASEISPAQMPRLLELQHEILGPDSGRCSVCEIFWGMDKGSYALPNRPEVLYCSNGSSPPDCSCAIGPSPVPDRKSLTQKELAGMQDDEVVSLAAGIMAKHGYVLLKQLKAIEPSLYNALRVRNISRQVLVKLAEQAKDAQIRPERSIPGRKPSIYSGRPRQELEDLVVAHMREGRTSIGHIMAVDTPLVKSVYAKSRLPAKINKRLQAEGLGGCVIPELPLGPALRDPMEWKKLGNTRLVGIAAECLNRFSCDLDTLGTIAPALTWEIRSRDLVPLVEDMAEKFHVK